MFQEKKYSVYGYLPNTLKFIKLKVWEILINKKGNGGPLRTTVNMWDDWIILKKTAFLLTFVFNFCKIFFQKSKFVNGEIVESCMLFFNYCKHILKKMETQWLELFMFYS